MSDLELVAVFGDGERLRAATPAAVVSASTLTGAATASRDAHIPGADKIGILCRGLVCRHRKQQRYEVEARKSHAQFFHGTIPLICMPNPGARCCGEFSKARKEPAVVWSEVTHVIDRTQSSAEFHYFVQTRSEP